tara:strand:- start:70 stop:291 length:222 start_codon:yes stop_codon:yes gene_type:complete
LAENLKNKNQRKQALSSTSPQRKIKMDYFDINHILDNLDPLLDISDEPMIYATNIDFDAVGIDTTAPEAQDGV